MIAAIDKIAIGIVRDRGMLADGTKIFRISHKSMMNDHLPRSSHIIF